MPRVIEDAGDDDYTLLVTDEGEVTASKRIPYDGVRIYTTKERALPMGRRTQSEYGLDIDTVIEHYCNRADTQTPRPQLAEDVARALKAVHHGGMADAQ